MYTIIVCTINIIYMVHAHIIYVHVRVFCIHMYRVILVRNTSRVCASRIMIWLNNRGFRLSPVHPPTLILPSQYSRSTLLLNGLINGYIQRASNPLCSCPAYLIYIVRTTGRRHWIHHFLLATLSPLPRRFLYTIYTN